MKVNRLALRVALLALPVLGAVISAPATAQRSIVIDVPANKNTLGNCGTNCQSLSLGSLNTEVTEIQIFSDGSISLPGDGYSNRFFAAQSNILYNVRSGYTVGSGSGPRTDFVNFYDPSRDLTGTLPQANFQIQFRNAAPGTFSRELEIAFAYDSNDAFGSNMVPDGAKIGFTSTGLGVIGGFAGNPLEQFVTNSNGLLLGEKASDSQFSFIIGTRPNTAFDRTIALLPGGVFKPVYAVPEPSTWAMMLAGFGVIGSQLRRRRRITGTA